MNHLTQYDNLLKQRKLLEAGIKRLKDTGHKHNESNEAIKLLESQLNKVLEKEKEICKVRI